MAEDYILDESEYEILETGETEPIISEEVKRKLESPIPEIIDQEDFDRKGYTLSDYLSLDEGQYPRNFRDNKGQAVSTGTGVSLAYAGSHLLSEEPFSLSGTLVGFAVASYLIGLRDQEMELDEALENSMEYWSENLKI